MIAYASRTSHRNLEALRRAGWRLMISAKGRHGHGGLRYALDNGAWHSFCHELPFDAASFLATYRELGPLADFVVLPDIVAGGHASLAYSLKWRDQLGVPLCPFMLAVQDGMAAMDVAQSIGPQLGIFVGGSTAFKERTMAAWGVIARGKGARLHIGRVNTVRRIALCAAAGADSFDGSGASRYATELPRLDLARLQGDLFADSGSKQ
jgi:hypothetical protein